MFEDSTFESNGKIRTRSRRWMIAALALNSSILLTMIVLPLVYPEALSRQDHTFLMAVPPPPSAPPTVVRQAAPTAATRAPMADPMAPPRQIPAYIFIARTPEPPANAGPIGAIDLGDSTPGGIGTAPLPAARPRVVHPAAPSVVRISTGVAASIAIYRPAPAYPAIAKAAGVQGTVVLSAVISKGGTVDNLRVESGPPMLQVAALDAVKQWRYKPYLLNGEPVAVETTVNVVFTLGR